MSYFVQHYLPLDNEDVSKLREEKNLETALGWTFGILFLLIFWFISDLFEMNIYWKLLWGSVVGVIYFFLAIGMRSSRKDKQKELGSGQKILIAGTVSVKLKEPMQYVKGDRHYLVVGAEKNEVDRFAFEAVNENDFVVLHYILPTERLLRYEIYPAAPAFNEDPPLQWSCIPMSEEEQGIFDRKAKRFAGVLGFNMLSMLLQLILIPLGIGFLLKFILNMSEKTWIDLYLIFIVFLLLTGRGIVWGINGLRKDRKKRMKKIRFARITKKHSGSKLVLSDLTTVEPEEDIFNAAKEGDMIEVHGSAHLDILLHARLINAQT